MNQRHSLAVLILNISVLKSQFGFFSFLAIMEKLGKKIVIMYSVPCNKYHFMLLKILLVLAFTPACFTDKFLQVNTEIIFEGVIMFYILKPKPIKANNEKSKQKRKRSNNKFNKRITGNKNIIFISNNKI